MKPQPGHLDLKKLEALILPVAFAAGVKRGQALHQKTLSEGKVIRRPKKFVILKGRKKKP